MLWLEVENLHSWFIWLTALDSDHGTITNTEQTLFTFVLLAVFYVLTCHFVPAMLFIYADKVEDSPVFVLLN